MAELDLTKRNHRFKDETGRRYGRLIVLGCDSITSCKARLIGPFDCCQRRTVGGQDLRRGRTTSCGCSRIQHGHARREKQTQEYRSWEAMLRRCENPKDVNFASYGGRGISICKRWHSFKHFFSDMGCRPTGLTLERVENSLGYFPSNCKWASPKEQARNRRDNRILTFNGKTLCATAWAELLGLKADTILDRMDRGDSIRRCLRPVKKR